MQKAPKTASFRGFLHGKEIYSRFTHLTGAQIFEFLVSIANSGSGIESRTAIILKPSPSGIELQK